MDGSPGFDMPYDLKLNNELQLIDLKYTGTIQLEERKRARDEVFAIARDKQIPRALVDLRDSNILMSEEDMVKFASAFRDADLPSNYHLACVTNPENTAENLVEILITLDGINARYFYDRDEAVEWLTAF